VRGFGHVLLDGALDTLPVKRQQLDIPGFREPGFGLRYGLLSWFHRFPRLAESEDAGLDGAGAVEAPFVFSDGLGDLPLENAGGGEDFDDGLAVFLEGLVLFGGEKVDLAGEAVFVGVDAGALHAGVRSWPGCAGGFLGNWA